MDEIGKTDGPGRVRRAHRHSRDPARAGSIVGVAYIDSNGNGVRDTGEVGLVGHTVSLAGTDDVGKAVNLTTTTEAGGGFFFLNLRPGTYRLSTGAVPTLLSSPQDFTN